MKSIKCFHYCRQQQNDDAVQRMITNRRITKPGFSLVLSLREWLSCQYQRTQTTLSESQKPQSSPLWSGLKSRTSSTRSLQGLNWGKKNNKGCYWSTQWSLWTQNNIYIFSRWELQTCSQKMSAWGRQEQNALCPHSLGFLVSMKKLHCLNLEKAD